MSARGAIAAIAVTLFATVAFYVFQRQLANVWLSLALADDVREVVDRSAEDQKALSRLDPAREADYRKRFARIDALRRRLEILAISRDDVAARLQTLLVAGFVLVGLPVAGLWLAARRREEWRLAALRDALVELSRGDEPESARALSGRDTIGKIATMIETTWEQMRDDRQRIESLRNLEQWQEAARRHAHEIRTPLTAARLELERLAAQTTGDEAQKTIASIRHDFDRLQAFTREFTSFASIGEPRVERVEVRSFLEEFRTTFAEAWPRLEVRTQADGDACVSIDRDMVRRVLMNLASNAALAVTGDRGTLDLRVDEAAGEVTIHVVDDGAGVDDAIRETLFDPYVTTRRVGDGMGLGLAIARKIMLDHGGDLRLSDSRPGRTEFVLLLPAAEKPC